MLKERPVCRQCDNLQKTIFYHDWALLEKVCQVFRDSNLAAKDGSICLEGVISKNRSMLAFIADHTWKDARSLLTSPCTGGMMECLNTSQGVQHGPKNTVILKCLSPFFAVDQWRYRMLFHDIRLARNNCIMVLSAFLLYVYLKNTCIITNSVYTCLKNT